MRLLSVFIAVVLYLHVPAVYSQETIPLYTTIPNERIAADEESNDTKNGISIKVSKPTLTVYLPSKEKACGTSVIICPGGGYGILVMDREGHAIAKKFIEQGIAAFVLKYRLPSDRIMQDKSIGPLQDAQQAIMTLRMRAAEWGILPDKIGIMGFSAGGHLASSAGTHFLQRTIAKESNISLRPDFMILVYPVISLSDSIGHKGTRENLLGKEPSKELVEKFSNETQVSSKTPPAFITHAGDDKAVPVANSICFYSALQKNGVPASLFIYSKGGHGFLKSPPQDVWMSDLTYWLQSNNFLPESTQIGEKQK
jgi:acetyl esterase/lipase